MFRRRPFAMLLFVLYVVSFGSASGICAQEARVQAVIDRFHNKIRKGKDVSEDYVIEGLVKI